MSDDGYSGPSCQLNSHYQPDSLCIGGITDANLASVRYTINNSDIMLPSVLVTIDVSNYRHNLDRGRSNDIIQSLKAADTAKNVSKEADQPDRVCDLADADCLAG